MNHRMAPASHAHGLLAWVRQRAVLAALVAALVLAAAPVAAQTPRTAPSEALGELTRTEPEADTDRAQYAPGRLIVHTRAPVAPDELIARQAVEAVEPIGRTGIQVLTVDPARRDAVAARLLALEAVADVELDPVLHAFRTPNDQFWNEQAGSRRIHAPHAWDLQVGVPQTTVAVLDTGVDASHPDLVNRTLRGLDVVNNDLNPHDDDLLGHGTQVTGVVVARGNNQRGVAGMCWRCRVLPVKVLDARGSGFASDAARGVRWAADHGADVINMSFGGRQDTRVLREAVAYARRKGVLLVAAAGNTNTTAKTYPGAYPGVVAVTGSGTDDRRYVNPRNPRRGSNYGRWVHLAAPWTNATTGPEHHYYNFSGTSSSAPVVSGIAGLLKSAAPRMSAARMKQLLFATALRNRRTGYTRFGRVEADRPLVWARRGAPVMGDWNGDGRDTPGWFKRGWWYLTNRQDGKRAQVIVRYGAARDVPVVGDWDGDGDDTIGVRRGDRWLLRNRNRAGQPDRDFRFGRPAARALTGDWDGDGNDTPGVRLGRWFALRNANSGGKADLSFPLGRRTDRGISGDWNAVGHDSVGVRRGNVWLLRQPLSSGRFTNSYRFGGRRQRGIAADHNGNGRDTPSVQSGWRWQLRFRQAGGRPDRVFTWGG